MKHPNSVIFSRPFYFTDVAVLFYRQYKQISLKNGLSRYPREQFNRDKHISNNETRRVNDFISIFLLY